MPMLDSELVSQGLQNEERRFETRAAKAKAFNDYRAAQTAMGLDVDPLALDKMRMEMAGNDPVAASMMPSGDALYKLAERANEQARVARMQVQTSMIDTQNKEREMIQVFSDNNPGMDKDTFKKRLTDIYGPETGAQLGQKYEGEFDTMANQSMQKELAKILQDPAWALVNTDDDLMRVFPAQAKRNPQLMKMALQEKMRLESQKDNSAALDLINKLPEAVRNDPNLLHSSAAPILGYQNWDAVPQQTRLLVDSMATGILKQKEIDAWSKTREALRPQLAEQAEKVRSDAKDKVKTVTGNVFSDPKYFVKSGNKKIVDPRLSGAMEGISQNSSVFPDDQSLAKAAQFVKKMYDKSPDKFDPNAAVIEFVSSSDNYNTQTTWENQQLDYYTRGQFPIPPNESFKAWNSEQSINMMSEMDQLEKVIANTNPIDRSIVLQNIEKGITQYSTVIEQIASDPIKKRIYEDFNMSDAISTRNALEEKLKILKNIRPPAPEVNPNSPGSVRAQTKSWGDVWIKSPFLNESAPRYQLKPGDSNAEYYAGQVGNFLNDATLDPWNVMNHIAEVPVNTLWYAGKGLLDGADKVADAWDFLNKPRMPAMPVESDKAGDIQRGEVVETISTTTGDLNAPFRQPVSYQATNTQPSMDEFLDALATVESGNNPNARASTTSAAGLFQFTRGTWTDMVRKYGKQTGIRETDIMNPQAQRVMVSFLTRDNAQDIMRNTGKVPDAADLHLAHFLGSSAASKLINNLGSGRLASDMFPDAAAANKTLFYRDGMPLTVDQFYERMGNKINKYMKPKDDRRSARDV